MTVKGQEDTNKTDKIETQANKCQETDIMHHDIFGVQAECYSTLLITSLLFSFLSLSPHMLCFEDCFSSVLVQHLQNDRYEG